MRVLQRISLKLIVLLGVLFLMNWAYSEWQYPEDLEKYTPMHSELESAQLADKIYLGDCSDVYCGSACDSDTSVSAFLKILMNDQKIAALSANGYQPSSYLTLIKALDSKVGEDKTIILTLNHRAFADHILLDWYYKPIIEQQLCLVQTRIPLLNRAMLTFYDPSSKRESLTLAKTEQWKNTSIEINGKTKTIAMLMEKAAGDSVATSYLEDFAFVMGEAQREQLALFNDIIHEVKSRGWKMVIHYVPINLDGLSHEKHSWLKDHALEQRQILLQHFKAMDVQVLDHSTLLSQDDFLGIKSNSHYTANGKRKLALGLSTALKVPVE